MWRVEHKVPERDRVEAHEGEQGIDVKLACECAQYVGTDSAFKYVRVEDGLCHLSADSKSADGWVQIAHCRKNKQNLPQCVAAKDQKDIEALKRCCVKDDGFVMSNACLADVREMQACINHMV